MIIPFTQNYWHCFSLFEATCIWKCSNCTFLYV